MGYCFKNGYGDLEVDQREINENFMIYTIIRDENSSEFITIATTRPETMLGDTAVAVNPKDENTNLVGKNVFYQLWGEK